MPEILGETLRLRDIRPDVDRFHVSEIRGFYHAVALFHLRSDRPQLAAAICRTLIELIGEDDPILVQLQFLIAKKNLEHMRRRMQEEKERAIRVKVPQSAGSEESLDLFAPGFHHAEIEILYRRDFSLPGSELNAILALPRDTLIEDLESVLRDSIARGPLYRKKQIDCSREETYFALHALFLLGELKAGDSLPLVLEVLSQPHEFLDYWFEDYLHEELWLPLSRLMEDRLDQTTEWMLSPGIPALPREVVAVSAAQIAQHQPERRAEVLDWFQHIMEFLLDSPSEDNILDTELVNGLVWQALNLSAVEFEPVIRALYEKDYVATSQVGDLEEALFSLSDPSPPLVKKPMLALPKLYSELSQLPSDLDPPTHAPLPGFSDSIPDDPFEIGGSPRSTEYSLGKGIPEKAPSKVGRNQPCPCGSGKKFKKCGG